MNTIAKSVALLTICSVNYLSKAQVLLSSYRKHHPDHNLFLLLVDKRQEVSVDDDVNVMWVEDLGIPNFLQFAFMYDVIELNTNVKPFALKKILNNHDMVVYLDPDIKVYSQLTYVFSELVNASLVVTPHSNTPILDGKKPDDLELMKFGGFNLGFIGVSKSNEGFRFLDWWSDRCLQFGFYEPQLGLAVDQKWVNLAPCFYPNMKILHHPGLNVAFWNLHERELSYKNEVWYVNNDTVLCFIHFSSFDLENPEIVAHKQNRFIKGMRPDFQELATEYAKELKSQSSEVKNSYGFDYFDNGVYITPALRRFYSALKESHFCEIQNPFDSKDNVFKFAKNKNLLSKGNIQSPRHTFKDMGRFSIQISAINWILKILLRLLGPNRYFNLMRYLGYVSSIRNQASVLK